MKYIRVFKGELNTKEFLVNLSKNPLPGKGMGVTEMRRRIRLLDAFESDENPIGYYMLEDADWDYLKELLKEVQFTAFHRDILTIVDDIEGALNQLPSEPTPAS